MSFGNTSSAHRSIHSVTKQHFYLTTLHFKVTIVHKCSLKTGMMRWKLISLIFMIWDQHNKEEYRKESIRRTFHIFHSFTAWNAETIVEHVFTFQDSPFDKNTLTSRKHIGSALTFSPAHSLLYKETVSQGGQTLSPHQTKPSLKSAWSVRWWAQSLDLLTNSSLLVSQETIGSFSGFVLRKSNNCCQDHLASYPSLQTYQADSEKTDLSLRCQMDLTSEFWIVFSVNVPLGHMEVRRVLGMYKGAKLGTQQTLKIFLY